MQRGGHFFFNFKHWLHQHSNKSSEKLNTKFKKFMQSHNMQSEKGKIAFVWSFWGSGF